MSLSCTKSGFVPDILCKLYRIIIMIQLLLYKIIQAAQQMKAETAALKNSFWRLPIFRTLNKMRTYPMYHTL